MTQPEQEQGTSQATKIALGALAILAMAAALYWYFTNLRPAANIDEPGQVIVEPVTPDQPAGVTPNSEEVTPLPSLDETQEEDLGTSEDGVGVGTQLAGIPKEGINPAVPLAGVPNTNPFSPLAIEGEGGEGTLDRPTPLPANNAVPDAPNYDAPSFSEPSAPVSTPRLGNGSATNNGGESDWDFGRAAPVTLERPATTPAGQGRSSSSAPRASDAGSRSDGAGSAAQGGVSGATASWDFGSDASLDSAGAPTANTALESTGPEDRDPASNAPTGADGQTNGVVAGLPTAAAALPQSFGKAASSAGTDNGAGPAAATPLGRSAGSAAAPDFVRQYGAASVSAPDDGTRLSRTLNARDYHFSGAVLGTTNTAIFKSAGGFDVVEEGEQLPGTDVVVRQIDDNRVVLALGNETVTLDLESLENF